MVLFKSRRSSEKCIKKRRNPLYHKDFRVISFLAARYKKGTASAGCCSFLLTKSKRRTTFEPSLRVGWDRAAPNERPRTHFRAIRWLQVPPPQPKKEQHPQDAVLFCLRSPNAEPPSSRPCGSDGIAPHQTNDLAHISARSGGYKSHLRNQKTSRTKFGKVLLFHET